MPVEVQEGLEESHKCSWCGHTGVDVKPETYYLGGQGVVHKFYCIDKEACRKRYRDKRRLDKGV